MVIVRPFTWQDLSALLDFVGQGHPEGSHDQYLRQQSFREVLEQPWLAPERDCCLLEAEGGVQGFCLVSPELPIGRAVLELEVAPAFSLSSAERELLRRGVVRARALGACMAHVCLQAGSPLADMLQGEGFQLARVYWSMVYQGDAPDPPVLPPGFRLRHFEEGDAARLTEAQNAAFAGSWGFCPNTVDQIEYRVRMSYTSPEGVLFLEEGDRVAGYCWTRLLPLDGRWRGIIGMIGVVPAYRGRRISQLALVAGMRRLKSAGAADIGLEVDSANTPAIRLYRSAGFEKTGELHWFELVFSPATNL